MSYFIRLADVCLAAYFLMNLALELVALRVAGRAVRRVERMRPSAGARLLLLLRLAPLGVSAAVVLAFCVPSYLRFEQDATESVGLLCSLLAVCGLATLGVSLARLVLGLVISAQSLKETSRPAFALVGFLRPRVIVSKRIREALSSTQMEAALRHEAAHSSAQDNLKRLAMFAAPRLLGSRGFRELEAQWSRLAEWAADDAAIAGEPRRAIALAEALVCVARLAGHTDRSPLVSSLVAREDELGERVDRLLAERSVSLPRTNMWFGAMALLAASGAILVAQRQGVLYLVHCAMERLVH